MRPYGFRTLGPREFRYHFRRKRCGFELVGVVGIAADQDAGLKAFDCERLAFVDVVLHLEARALDTLDLRLDSDPVAISRWDVEFGSRIDHGDADQAVLA